MEFLTTREISGSIDRIIREARETITLVTPYVSIPEVVVDRLKEALDRKVRLRILIGKTFPRLEEEEKFSYLRGAEVLFYEDLHAKCYFNERRAIITSMNLHRYSEQNNREMGIMLTREEHGSIYDEIVAETENIAKASRPRVDGGHRAPLSGPGTCIRCGEDIDLNPLRPLCPGCYSEWAEWSNEDYREQYCHGCGREVTTSMRKPLCRSCYGTV